MTPLRIGKAALLLAAFAPNSLYAQDSDVRISSVTTTPNPVPERESLQLQIVVDAPIATPISEPTFLAPDFIQAGSPDIRFLPQDSEQGPKTRKKFSFTFVLMPKKAGDFIVKNIQAKAQGKSVTTPDVRVKVTSSPGGPLARPSLPSAPPRSAFDDEDEAANPAAPNYNGSPFPGATPPQRPHGGASIPDRFNSDFTVHASLSKSKAYVGEPIVVEYYLFDFGGLRQMDVQKWPTFDGFWKEDLELITQPSFEDVYLRDQEMRRAFLARYALYGIKPGKFYVDKLGIRGKYIGSNVRPGMFFPMDLRTGQHYSQDVTVEIVPLPTEGRPEKFSGAVGNFQLRLEADKLSLTQNTPVTLTLVLSGTGNFQAIDSIKLPLPPDFELYESTANGRATAPIGVRQELESKKTFQVIAIPRKAGTFEVPAVNWTFFNTQKQTYDSLTTQPLTIEVQPGNGAQDPANPNSYLNPSSSKQDSGPQPGELRGLKPVALDKPERMDEYLKWGLIGLLAANLLLAVGFLRSRSRGLVRLVKSMDPFSEARIQLLQAKGIRDAEWQGALEEVVLTVMEVLLKTNPRGMTKQDLQELWRARGYPEVLFNRASALLDELDRHRFSSQKLTGSGTKELRSRLTKEAESLLTEAAHEKARSK